MPKRNQLKKVPTKCSDHPQQDLMFVCTDDYDTLVCSTCVTTTHNGHHFVEIQDYVLQKRESMNAFIIEAEAELPRIQHKIETADKKLDGNATFFKDLISDIQKQSGLLKADIDRISDNYVFLCKQMEEENDERVKQHKKDLKSTFESMTDLLKTCKGVMSRDNDIEMIETEKTIPEERKTPPDFPLKAAVFREGNSSTEQKIRVFGILSIEGDLSDRSEGSSRMESASLEMIAEFTHPKSPFSLCPTEGNQAWILERLNDEIALVDQSGKVNRNIKCDARVCDISVSPVTRNLWMACMDRKIREVRTSTIPVIKFRVEDVPYSICVTNEDHVVVGMMRKVLVFNNMGYLQHAMDKFSSLARMIRKPHHISECHTSGEIAVVVNDNNGSSRVHVTIVDNVLQLKYHHTGDSVIVRNGSIRPSGYAPNRVFAPNDVCYDTKRNLLIADRINKAIIIVKRKAKQVQTQIILGDDREPSAIGIQDGGVLWVGFSDGQIKVFKYL